MTLMGAVAILISACLIALLGWNDPKRLRNVSNGLMLRSPTSSQHRRLMAWMALLPGLVLIAVGEWWALLFWLGASYTLGWAAAQILTRWSTSPPAERR